ncbi:8118_t:CDS:2, partial [Cetraspora pellucida]
NAGKRTKKPTISRELCEIFEKCQNGENILLELSESKKIKGDHIQTYPETDYKSKFIQHTSSFYSGDGLSQITITMGGSA